MIPRSLQVVCNYQSTAAVLASIIKELSEEQICCHLAVITVVQLAESCDGT